MQQPTKECASQESTPYIRLQWCVHEWVRENGRSVEVDLTSTLRSPSSAVEQVRGNKAGVTERVLGLPLTIGLMGSLVDMRSEGKVKTYTYMYRPVVNDPDGTKRKERLSLPWSWPTSVIP